MIYIQLALESITMPEVYEGPNTDLFFSEYFYDDCHFNVRDSRLLE